MLLRRSMRVQWNGLPNLRRICNVFLPFLLGAIVVHIYHQYQLRSVPTSWEEHLGLRRFKSAFVAQEADEDPLVRPTKKLKEYILGDITELQEKSNGNGDSKRLRKDVGQRVGPTVQAKVQKSSKVIETQKVLNTKNVVQGHSLSQNSQQLTNKFKLPFVEWTSGQVLQHLGAYTPPSESEVAEALSTRKGFDEKPPGLFVKGWKTPCWIGNTAYRKSKLKCLPAFYIPGFPKCGTMDLWYRLKRHPQLRALTSRETNWWAQTRLQLNNSVPLGQFSGMLGDSLERWGKTAPNLLLGEGTPSNIWMAHNEIRQMVNVTDEPMAAPRVLTPHLIKKYTPRAKFVVIMRNPADRIFSHFCYFGNKTRNPNDYQFTRSPARFHRLVVQMIAMYQDCFARRSIRDCAYDPNLSKECNTFKIRIDRTLYAVYISDWLKIFSREQFYFVRSEDYRDTTATILTEMYDFLKLSRLSKKSLDYIASRPHIHTKGSYSVSMPPMWNETRRLLDDFFRPFNGALATLLNDKTFLWEKETRSSMYPGG